MRTDNRQQTRGYQWGEGKEIEKWWGTMYK